VLSKLTPHERTNILLLGSDTWATDDNYGHTDSIVVVTLDPTSKRAAMLSIPRDLWVSIPGYGENRINQAYRLGEIKQHPGGGPALIKETIEANFGIRIDHYALVKSTGFAQIIDMMGGIEVCVPETLDAASYYGYPATTINKKAYYSFVPASTVLLPETDPAAALDPARGYQFLYIEAGWHTLDGNTALQYARSRASITADFARVQRQQAVLMAMRSKALQMDLIPKIPELWYAMQATYQTDLTFSDALTLAQLAGTIAADHIQTLVISHDQTQAYRTPEGAQVLLPNRAAIQTLIGDVFAVTIPQTSPTQLEVKAVQPTDPIPNTVLPATAAVWIK
jgi:LCP family protein required for cell wall assembly